MKRFALTGAAGYIAPKHMDAIKQVGGSLVAALDPNDSVGQMDAFFPEALYFNNFERFERFINLQRSEGIGLDYLSICSPNHIHDTHCRFALVQGMNAICEKPLVLNPWNLDILQKAEEESSNRIYNILQLRLHPHIIKLKNWVDSHAKNEKYTIDLNYITSRGPWYHISWKGQEDKSGGITSNIGVHFFDMLIWIFGPVQTSTVLEHNRNFAAGNLELENANVNWFLSVDARHLKFSNNNKGHQKTYRSLIVDNKEIDFSLGFEDLHYSSYQSILKNEGFTTNEVRPVIELIHNIRTSKITHNSSMAHHMLHKIKGID